MAHENNTDFGNLQEELGTHRKKALQQVGCRKTRSNLNRGKNREEDNLAKDPFKKVSSGIKKRRNKKGGRMPRRGAFKVEISNLESEVAMKEISMYMKDLKFQSYRFVRSGNKNVTDKTEVELPSMSEALRLIGLLNGVKLNGIELSLSLITTSMKNKKRSKVVKKVPVPTNDASAADSDVDRDVEEEEEEEEEYEEGEGEKE